MKLALCNEVIRDLPFDRQCAFAAAVGFEGLEIAPFTLAENPETLGEAEARTVRAALEAEGLACCSLHWLLAAPEGVSITSADPAVQRRTRDLMARLIDFAAAVGAPVMVHGSPAQRVLEEGAEADGRANAREAFAAAGAHAAKAGVEYLIEPLARRETDHINTIEEAADIVRAVDSPGLKTMLDTCATASNDTDVVAELEAWWDTGLIRHIHVNDPNRRGPGEGTLAFGPIFKALHRLGYTGWVSAEPFVYLPDGPACAARAAGTLTALRQELAP
ncbi:MAG: sugar phosphate isomerase/epimerase family protein [Pseudomonadota bacterium]